MIRDADRADVPALVRMAQAFHAHASPGLGFDPLKVERVAHMMIGSPQVFAGVLDVDGAPRGMLIAVLSENMFGPGYLAQELAWWVDPEARGGSGAMRLVRAYLRWAKGAGATIRNLASRDERTARVYRAMGARPSEQHWTI